MPRRSPLRTCASCEWIWTSTDPTRMCPMCGFGSYAASYVYGRKARQHAQTQEPWVRNQVSTFHLLLAHAIKYRPKAVAAVLSRLRKTLARIKYKP